jgi:diguanylate cyclase (GGDEF)-like protein
MFSGAAEGTVTMQELVQLPLLSAILLLVFLLARQRARMASRLEEIAGCDPLTGLPGRDRFMQGFEQAISSAADQGLAIAILSIDLDGLKTINDALGHEAGDQVLIETAKRLRGAVRADDLVARIGGDEFMILLKAEATTIPRIVERIIEAAQQPVLLAGKPVSVTVSAGVALSKQPALRQRDAILRDADAALQRVKAAGKAGYEVFAPVAA